MGLPEAILVCNILMIIMSVGEARHDSAPKSVNFTSFGSDAYQKFILLGSAISKGALQVTAESSNPRYPSANQTGRALLNQSFRLWEHRSSGPPIMASFHTSFTLNIDPLRDPIGGEGLAFIIAPLPDVPENSYGRWLGLVNASTDGNSNNKLLAVEFDTKMNGNDPDDNHVGIDINSINSTRAGSLTPSHIYLKSASNITAWIVYNNSKLDVYVANKSADQRRPSKPIVSYPVDLSKVLNDTVYFGFSASTGDTTELNCVLSWDFTIFEPTEDSKKWVIALAVSLPVAFFAAIMIMFAVYFVYRRRLSDREIKGELKNYIRNGPRGYRYEHLKKATGNFDGRFELGRGGFGVVYKGILPNEKSWVAVKRIAKDSKQGKEEFFAEIKIISHLRHRNLVGLLGWCHKQGELLLVYEYMANGSVDRHIFTADSSDGNGEEGCVILGWSQRYKILVGVASALTYLHQECEQQVIHRDLKSSNIMLDSQYNARLGDFGLARLIEQDRASYSTTRIAGTLGYIAPECFHTGKATVESDVYGFGAVALEVACGRPIRRGGEADLVDWVWKQYRRGRLMDSADARLRGMFDEEEMRCVLMVGLACSRSNPKDRPTIIEVSQMLGKTSPAPWVPPVRPPFIWQHDSSPSPSLSTNSFATISHDEVSHVESIPQAISMGERRCGVERCPRERLELLCFECWYTRTHY